MKYKIGELAKLLNISTNTVRRYEQNGYIQAVRDANSGYRYHDDDGVFGITNAKLLRKYGFTHEELHGMQQAAVFQEVYEKDCVEQVYVLYKQGGKLLQEPERLEKVQEITGAMAKGDRYVDGAWYHFDEVTGVLN